MSQALEQNRLAARRCLRFDTIDQAIADAERIAALEHSGDAHYTGNWTAGQMLNHVGAWAEYQYVPCPLKVPFFIRWLVWPMRSRFLNKALPAGRRVPGVADGTLDTQRVSAEAGLARFKAAFERLKRDVPTHPSPLFGVMTQGDAIKLNLRHAELHFSFVAG